MARAVKAKSTTTAAKRAVKKAASGLKSKAKTTLKTTAKKAKSKGRSLKSKAKSSLRSNTKALKSKARSVERKTSKAATSVVQDVSAVVSRWAAQGQHALEAAQKKISQEIDALAKAGRKTVRRAKAAF